VRSVSGRDLKNEEEVNDLRIVPLQMVGPVPLVQACRHHLLDWDKAPVMIGTVIDHSFAIDQVIRHLPVHDGQEDPWDIKPKSGVPTCTSQSWLSVVLPRILTL
jgi:hypothetical protein